MSNAPLSDCCWSLFGRLLPPKQKDSKGSASAGQALDLAAGELTPKLSDRTADVRGRQWPTRSGLLLAAEAACRKRRQTAKASEGLKAI